MVNSYISVSKAVDSRVFIGITIVLPGGFSVFTQICRRPSRAFTCQQVGGKKPASVHSRLDGVTGAGSIKLCARMILIPLKT